MLILSPQGLFCPAGGFHIDPHAAVEHAVITHAHSDHARRGSRFYYCARSGADLLKSRVGKNISLKTVAFGEKFALGAVQVSLHPAGHILGSAQVRLEHGGRIWVASGDYKREFDPTCEPFESVACDVFVTEATFGTPRFRWNKQADLGKQIHDWWLGNSREGYNSLLYAYSLGKAQRILGLLQGRMPRPIYCDESVSKLSECYRAQGIGLAPTICMSKVALETRFAGELLLAPQSFLKSERAPILGAKFRTAFASGWMARDSGSYDHGFLISDHADWDDLLRTIHETGAKRVYVQHRGQGALVRHLNSIGISAFSDAALEPGAGPEAVTGEQLSFL